MQRMDADKKEKKIKRKNRDGEKNYGNVENSQNTRKQNQKNIGEMIFFFAEFPCAINSMFSEHGRSEKGDVRRENGNQLLSSSGFSLLCSCKCKTVFITVLLKGRLLRERM